MLFQNSLLAGLLGDPRDERGRRLVAADVGVVLVVQVQGQAQRVVAELVRVARHGARLEVALEHDRRIRRPHLRGELGDLRVDLLQRRQQVRVYAVQPGARERRAELQLVEPLGGVAGRLLPRRVQVADREVALHAALPERLLHIGAERLVLLLGTARGRGDGRRPSRASSSPCLGSRRRRRRRALRAVLRRLRAPAGRRTSAARAIPASGRSGRRGSAPPPSSGRTSANRASVRSVRSLTPAVARAPAAACNGDAPCPLADVNASMATGADAAGLAADHGRRDRGRPSCSGAADGVPRARRARRR